MKAPHFWSADLDPYSREAAPLTRALLTPVAALYSMITTRRIARAHPETVPIPVICVGNLTAGGSGKTPIVQALTTHLSTHGIKAASLSRGYGGRLSGPLEVDADKHTPGEVGDEPLMLAVTSPAWISRDRAAGARAMAAAGVEAIIMDDGHQNPTLAKDFSLLVIDAAAPFGNGHVIPKGPLREPIAAGLKRADAVVLVGDGPVPASVAASGLPTLRAHLKPTTPLPAGPLIAFAGIGRPERFFADIKANSGDLIDYASFADHHVYSPSQLQSLSQNATEQGARLVTTEKDYVRIPPEYRTDITPVKVTAQFDDMPALLSLVMPLFERAR